MYMSNYVGSGAEGGEIRACHQPQILALGLTFHSLLARFCCIPIERKKKKMSRNERGKDFIGGREVGQVGKGRYASICLSN